MTDSSTLNGVHPELVQKIGRVLEAMLALGFPMMVTDGVRTEQQQQVLYAEGRTAPGKIVTNADGVLHLSNHQVKPDGYGHAVDACFVDANGQPSWDARWPWSCYGACGEALGLTWGGSWTMHDLPHLEIPVAVVTQKVA